MRYVGIDVGKKRCQGCVMDERGAIANEFVFDNTHDDIQELLSKVHPEFKAVLESTDNLWLTIYEALEDCVPRPTIRQGDVESRVVPISMNFMLINHLSIIQHHHSHR